MKINENYILRQISDMWVVLPLESAALDFNGMMTVNESGCFLWNLLEKGCEREELIAAMSAEYDAPRDVIEADVDAFVEKLKGIGCLE